MVNVFGYCFGLELHTSFVNAMELYLLMNGLKIKKAFRLFDFSPILMKSTKSSKDQLFERI